MRFTSVSAIERTVQVMLQAEVDRGSNRALINEVFNGHPPFSEEELDLNNGQTNVNFLEGTKIASDARGQLENAHQKPGNFFTVTLTYGPTHKRLSWGRIITKEINRVMKESLPFFEMQRSTFASLVLHGIGPTMWPDRFKWVGDALPVADVLLPGGTHLTMDDCEHFAVLRNYTPGKLWRMTHGPRVDPAWNMPLVNKILSEKEKEISTGIATSATMDDYWQPEKVAERFKADGGLYSTVADKLPTIKCWDFYFLDKDAKQVGWRRRIIQDTNESGRKDLSTAPEFLYDPGNRVYAPKLSQILHFQFGDCSAVGPFLYHSVRSLGFMLFAVCHLQNRMRCRLNDQGFRMLLEFFRVSSPEDYNRLKTVDLQNMGLVPHGLDWVKAEERYKPPRDYVELIMQLNRQSMSENSASFTQAYDMMGEQNSRETATAVMAKVQAATALVSSMVNRTYNYEHFRYLEICRRFCTPNSPDPDVRNFRACVLKQDVPEEALDSKHWILEVQRVMGAGNKTLELYQADRLMNSYNLFDPQSQREILHLFTETTTDNPRLADRLVPIDQKVISDSVHDAELALGTLMQGLPVTLRRGMNHIEYVERLLFGMGMIVGGINQNRGGMATPQEVQGLANAIQHTAQHIQIIAQDENEKQRVKQYGDALSELQNNVKAYAQRLQQAQQAQPGGNGGADPKDVAKAQVMVQQAQTKAELQKAAHAQRTAQRQAQWTMEQRRAQEEHQMDMAERAQEMVMNEQAKDLETEGKILRANREQSKTKPKKSK